MEKHLLVIETHNPYTARAYEAIANKYADGFELENRHRSFCSHEGDRDIRHYSRFKMYVTKEQEKSIREAVHKIGFPNFMMEVVR